MYACTVPPNSSTARLMRLTHSPIRAFTPSGPRRSPSAVDPTTPANRPVSGRSSSARATATDRSSVASDGWDEGVLPSGPAEPDATGGRGVPQDGQNRAPGGTGAPHVGHGAGMS